MKQVLVLAHATDAGAASVAALLRRRLGPGGVRVLRPEVLGLAKWSHRVSALGRGSTRLEWPGTEPLASADIGAALNRLRYLPVARFRRSSARDRDYAAAELQALVVSWLGEMGERVVHAVRRHPWVTPQLSLLQWASAAAACGLPVARRRIATSKRWGPGAGAQDAFGARSFGGVLVAGDRTEGEFRERFGRQCLATARTLGFALLEFRFAVTSQGPVLVDVEPMPALDQAAAIEAACHLLLERLERESR